jgi:hypothetical protein
MDSADDDDESFIVEGCVPESIVFQANGQDDQQLFAWRVYPDTVRSILYLLGGGRQMMILRLLYWQSLENRNASFDSRVRRLLGT